MSARSVDAKRASRAIGAMFYLAFGGAWIEYFFFRFSGVQPLPLAVVALVTMGLLVFAYRRYQRYQPALANEPATPEQKKADRLFHLVNAGQWVVILVAGNVLANVGLSAWIIPCAIFVVGLHFLPLAHVLANPPHYATGLALMALAAAYPFVAAAGPASPVGCLGAGLILWASAFWALAR